jgi:hypothetical protein
MKWIAPNFHADKNGATTTHRNRDFDDLATVNRNREIREIRIPPRYVTANFVPVTLSNSPGVRCRRRCKSQS